MAALALGVSGCSTRTSPTTRRTDGAIPDAISTGTCALDMDCDDGFSCTEDRCNASGACEHVRDDAACDDGSACTGIDRCSPESPMANVTSGCLAGVPPDCDDGNTCTMDRCLEPEGTCNHEAMDADRDGHAVASCAGGDDCNDADASVHPAAPEACNSVDDNCNGSTDEGCATGVPNDSCATAIDVTGGGTFTGTTCGADDTLALGCGALGAADVFYSIRTIPEGSSYNLGVTDGFVIQYVQMICSGNGGCGASSLGIGGGGGITWWFAIERADGGCGDFTFTAVGR